MISHVPKGYDKPRMTTKDEKCGPCIQVTVQGTKVANTLIYHTRQPEGCTPSTPPTCQVNNTQYHMCSLGGRIHCYNPAEAKSITVYQMAIYTTECGRPELLNKTEFTVLKRPVTVTFDACQAINRNCLKATCGSLDWERSYMLNKKYLCHDKGECYDRSTYSYCPYWSCVVMWSGDYPGGNQKCKIETGIASSNCLRNNCNPVKFTCSPTQPWEARYGLGIYGTGPDPHVTLLWTVTKHTRQLQDTKGLFWSYYLEMEKLNIPEIPQQVTNTFVKLAEDIAHTLGVTNCFVCGGTNMGEKWPWEAQELNYSKVLEMDLNNNLTYTKGKDGDWTLTTNLVGHVCFSRKETKGCKKVGNLICTGKWEDGMWWSGDNTSAGNDEGALFMVTGLGYLTDPDNQTLEWLAPDGQYWICGKMAYGHLPINWCGACVLGIIRPGFFLLPLRTKQILGVPVYDEVGNQNRRKRHVDTSLISKVHIGGNQHDWGEEEWPAERIIQVYGPATWAEDGMYGYRTPVYILNRLIRLQAVVEIITNETVKGLTQLARESVKSRTYIMQNRLALDYLLAKEGGVCGKFNLTNCCIEIDESGKVIKEITDKMVKVAHVPVQKWRGLDLKEMFSGWWPKLPGLQAIVGLIGLIAAGCVIIPCVLPIFVRIISNNLSLLAERKATAQVMALWQYTSLRHQEGREEEPEYVTLLGVSDESQRGE